jgi:hypothetical protein
MDKGVGMSANEKLIKLIEAMIRKEIKEQLPRLVPQVVKEVMSNMILEANTSVPTPSYSNSEKRRNLQENRNEEFEDYPTMGARPKTSMDLASMVGWDGDAPGIGGANFAPSRKNDMITVDSAISESGNIIPIRPEQVPEFVTNAVNKDYSGILSRLNVTKKNG